MKKYIKNKVYNIDVNGKARECVYLGCELGHYVFEIVGTTNLVFKTI